MSVSMSVARPLIVAAMLMALPAVNAHSSEDDPLPFAFSMGGFFKLHAMRGDISRGRDRMGDSQLWIPHVPVTARPPGERHRAAVHARDSRIWARIVRSGSPVGRVEALLEYDFHDRPERHAPRLRHAYLVAGPLQVGHTWTTFTNTAALPDLDTGTAVGAVATRHEVLRWNQPLNDTLSMMLAFENALSRVHRAGTPGFQSRDRRRSPDVALRLNYQPPRMDLAVIALFRDVQVDDPDLGIRESRRGAAVGISGRVQLDGLDNLRFTFNYGDAAARYSTLATYADGVYGSGESLTLNTLHSGLVAWQHYWRAPQWRSTIALSYSRTDLPSHAAAALTRAARSAHANLIYARTSRSSVGIEYLYGWRKTADGAEGDMNRLQLTLRVNW